MTAPANTTVDTDAYRVLGAATSRAFADGTLDLDGLAQVCRHVLDLDLDQARSVLAVPPKTTDTQRA
ncbi:hypothetical protein [Gordonia soli]|uniref:Uncharacterized protein n=1 Tax=Gordonia soli NBRC 108243 TaxID=1223545 RepID=M0QKT2_9ACTN|nr:hypothetical protein [Gordonia soli]GAC68866.1 hypothetical protein GS4_19_00560 [Gordonia soli NBRC 108243]